ncbi:MAG: type II toxin-antitoxin system HicA family toxin [bacterium]|nr:type II toxin-antitoxin system HicA family toxin [bacterium]
MSKPKVLSGQDVVRIFEHFEFSVFSQKGSHIKMRRESDGSRQTLTIPNHKELDRGTVSSLFRQASAYISQAELRPHFFND